MTVKTVTAYELRKQKILEAKKEFIAKVCNKTTECSKCPFLNERVCESEQATVSDYKFAIEYFEGRATSFVKRNRSSNYRAPYEYNGEKLTLSELSKTYGISYHTLRHRIDRGWSVADAIEKPIDNTRKPKTKKGRILCIDVTNAAK